MILHRESAGSRFMQSARVLTDKNNTKKDKSSAQNKDVLVEGTRKPALRLRRSGGVLVGFRVCGRKTMWRKSRGLETIE